MAKNNKSQTAPPNDADEQQDKDAPINPWTENFVQIAQYLVRDYRDKVRVAPEFPLFQKPMKIDAVIIIQEDGIIIDNALMRSFKRHNIIEFKSPNDTLDIEAFDKTISYFYAYLSKERMNYTPPIGFDDVTLSLITVRKPIKLLKMLQDERKYKIVDTETPGIYYIIKNGFIPEKILLVVSSELPSDERDQCLVWLRTLRNDLTAEEAVNVVKNAEIVDDHEFIWNVVKFVLGVNSQILPEVKRIMVANAEVQKFFWDVAIESGAAAKAAEEAKKNMARKMLAKNKPIDEVIEFTGLDHADVVIMAGAMGRRIAEP